MVRIKIIEKGFSSWKKAIQEKKRRQVRFFVKWIFLFLGIFLLANFVVEILHTIKFSFWNREHQFSLVLVQPKDGGVWLVALKSELSEMVLLKVPSETIVGGALGFGEVKIGSLTGLAEIESIPEANMLIEAVRQNFGIPVVGFLRLTKQEESLLMIFLKGLTGQNKTNMTKLELLKILWFVKSLRLDQIQTFDLKDTSSLALQTEPDGSVIYRIQKAQLDIFINRYFSDHSLTEEKITWEIFNGTSHSGLAELVGRLLRNTGSIVVSLNTVSPTSKSVLYKSSKLKNVNYGVVFWSKILNLPVEEGLPAEAKSDVVVLLGDDFWERCCRRN